MFRKPRRIIVTIDCLAIVRSRDFNPNWKDDPNANVPLTDLVSLSFPLMLDNPFGRRRPTLQDAFSAIRATLVSEGYSKAYSLHFTIYSPNDSIIWSGYITKWGASENRADAAETSLALT